MESTSLLLIGVCLLLTAPWSSAAPRALLQNPPGGSPLSLATSLDAPIVWAPCAAAYTLGRTTLARQLCAAYVGCCTILSLTLQALLCTAQAV